MTIYMDIKQKKSKPLTEKQALTIMTKRKSCIQKYRNSLTKTAKKHVKFDKPLEEVHEIPSIGEPEPKVNKKTKEPKVKEPKVKEPKVKEPKVKEPKVKEPKVKEPKVKEPKAKAKAKAKSKAKAKEPSSEEIEDL